MKIDLKKEEHNLAHVEIEIPAKDGLNAYNRAVKSYAQHVNIPGFRRGKAPRNIVERQIGKERIVAEALETLLPSAFQRVILENKLDVLMQPKIENYNLIYYKNIITPYQKDYLIQMNLQSLHLNLHYNLYFLYYHLYYRYFFFHLYCYSFLSFGYFFHLCYSFY